MASSPLTLQKIHPWSARCIPLWVFVVVTPALSGCSFWVQNNNAQGEPGVSVGEDGGRFSPDVEPDAQDDGGRIEMRDGGLPVDSGVIVDAGPPPLPDVCEGTEVFPVHLLAERFTESVYPLTTRQSGGCLNCHASDSGRLLVMGTTGTDSFHRIRTGGFFSFEAGSFSDRIERDSMPLGDVKWTDAEKSILTQFTCEVLAFEAENPVAQDEVFPPALDLPYDGAASNEYDNTFLTYEQLKGRIQVQFNDDWVRDGQDRFLDHIALFGGVDFQNAFIPSRGVTPEFLVGLETLSREVCEQAEQNSTGPFVGIDTNAPILEEPASSITSFHPRDYLHVDRNGMERTSPFGSNFDSDPPYVLAWSNGGVLMSFAPPVAGDYRVRVRARGDEAGADLPVMQVQLGLATAVDHEVPEAPGYQTYESVFSVTPGSEPLPLGAYFTNDFYDPDFPDATQRDRNLFISTIEVEGPLAGSTGGASGARQATFARLSSLFERILLRAPLRDADPALDEVEPLYTLLQSLENFDGNRALAWSGVCEGLLQHPDFLYTRSPTFDTSDASRKERMLVVKTALDLLNRPPTPDELSRFDLGQVDRAALIEEWLASDTFRDALFHRARVLLETDGSAIGDEPARLLTWIFLNDRPIRDLLTAEFTIDENFEMQTRPPEHGPTGLLTMKGYISGKPGLPHYNYAARVLQGFLGFIFEVPPEAFEARATATAASTVDEASICFNCHVVLTPLAHQRLRWDDDGNYRNTDDNGEEIDDSDRGMVSIYPYAGQGLAAFSAQAVRKEGFVRRQSNDVFSMLMNRPMRHDRDERILYRNLWDVANSGEGTFKSVLRTLLFDEVYVNPVGSR